MSSLGAKILGRENDFFGPNNNGEAKIRLNRSAQNKADLQFMEEHKISAPPSLHNPFILDL